MKAYIGCKIIKAEPQAKDGQPGYCVVYADDYVSWSPKQVFEEAYRPVSDGEREIIDTTHALKPKRRPLVASEEVGEPKEILNADEDRDGPVPFGG